MENGRIRRSNFQLFESFNSVFFLSIMNLKLFIQSWFHLIERMYCGVHLMENNEIISGNDFQVVNRPQGPFSKNQLWFGRNRRQPKILILASKRLLC